MGVTVRQKVIFSGIFLLVIVTTARAGQYKVTRVRVKRGTAMYLGVVIGRDI